MLSLTVLFFVSLAELSLLNSVSSNEGRTAKDLPRHYISHDPPYHDYHNNEGYPPPNFQNKYPQPQFPPGFQHTREFHERNFGAPRHGKEGRVRFEDETVEYKNKSLREIPLDFLQNLDNTEINELLTNYVDGYQAGTLFENRFGDDSPGQERKAGSPTIPAKAICAPENASVSLMTSDDPTILYIPKCTRIERCGGCCSHKLLACQPTETDTVSVQVVKTQYVGAKKLKYIGKEVILLERHLKCKCSCKVKAEHCQSNQQYRPEECACACKNMDEAEKCNRYPDIKYFDFETCTCRCNHTMQCSTGSIFDNNECRCKIIPQRRYAKFERKSSSIGDKLIAPLEDDEDLY